MTRIEKLERALEAIKAYLRSCVEMGDWHGVMDAAVDIREIEAELRGLRGD